MSQRERLRAFDARVHGHALRHGLADLAQYVPVDGDRVPNITVLIDRNQVELVGDGPAVVSGNRITATIQRADVGRPSSGDRLVVGCETFVLDGLVDEDESRTVWVVKNG